MDHIIDEMIDQYGVEEILDTLSPLLSDKRIERIEAMLQNRVQSVQLAVESPHDIHNALAIVRSSEAFGVNHIHIINENLRRNKGKRTVKGTSRWTHVKYYPTLNNFLGMQKRKDFLLAGACPEGDCLLEELPVEKPICLLFGNEHKGLSPEAIAACDIKYQIPMYGMVESFNLSVSAAISLYDVIQRKRKFLGDSSDYSGEKLAKERAWAYIRALGHTKVKSILNQVAPR